MGKSIDKSIKAEAIKLVEEHGVNATKVFQENLVLVVLLFIVG